MPDLDTAKERASFETLREDFEVGVSLMRAGRYLDAVDEARAQADAHARTCARLREERAESEALLREIREEIGAAWFAGGVGILEALRRKTRALERLLNGVPLPGGGGA